MLTELITAIIVAICGFLGTFVIGFGFKEPLKSFKISEKFQIIYSIIFGVMCSIIYLISKGIIPIPDKYQGLIAIIFIVGYLFLLGYTGANQKKL
jgi:hypothetical protein